LLSGSIPAIAGEAAAVGDGVEFSLTEGDDLQTGELRTGAGHIDRTGVLALQLKVRTGLRGVGDGRWAVLLAGLREGSTDEREDECRRETRGCETLPQRSRSRVVPITTQNQH